MTKLNQIQLRAADFLPPLSLSTAYSNYHCNFHVRDENIRKERAQTVLCNKIYNNFFIFSQALRQNKKRNSIFVMHIL